MALIMMRRTITALLLLPILASTPALADQLSRADKLRSLYSNQFAFDARGVPVVTVAIADGLREAIIESDEPPRLLPDGEAGSEVRAGKRWQVTLKRGSRPARARYFAILARHHYGGLAPMREDLRRWQTRGLKPEIMEVGTVFGVKGKVFDSRAFLLVSGPHRGRSRAVSVSEAQAKKYGFSRPSAVAKLERRPSGRFQAVALDTPASARATATIKDVLWFAPAPGKRIKVSYNRGGARVTKPYWGEVYVAADRAGRMVLVNAVPADKLLAGLVPAEIFPSAPEAALKAQAVAARGQLLAKIGTRHLEDPHLLCSRVHCQVYAGAGQEHPRTTAAVEATRGQLLVRQNGGLVDTVYSAVCGGHTEHNDNVWPVPPDNNLRGHLDAPADDRAMAPYRRGIRDKVLARWLARPPASWCAKSRYNKKKIRWTVRLSSARVDRLTAALGVGKVRSIEVLQRGISGRARAVKVSGTRGAKTVKGELTIRRQFGGLRSSMFIVQAEAGPGGGPPAAFVFTGGGWGHGVGMCQTGSTGMGAAGKTHQQILQHYYPGSQLKKLY